MTDIERRAAVHTIAERASSLGQLMDHLLLGSRAGADELVIRIEGFDLAELLQAATLGLPVLSELHRVEVDIPEGLPLVSGDAFATDIMLGQLLENAQVFAGRRAHQGRGVGGRRPGGGGRGRRGSGHPPSEQGERLRAIRPRGQR